MTELLCYKLSDLYEMSSGISTKPSQAGHGFPFCSFSTVFNNVILPDVLPDLMDTNDDEQVTFSIKCGDVFLTRTSETVDELGMSSVAVKDYPHATYSGFLKRLRPITDITYPKYMAWYFRSNYFRKVMTNKAVMTLRASLNEDIFNDIEIYLPDYETQKKIGDFLYDIECLRLNNISICADLEAMAKQIYDYWFVQFDFPDANGNPYKSSGGKMVWCEKLDREIPEGWDVKSVGELCHENRGVSYTAKDLKDNGVHMLTLGCANKDGSFNETGIQSFDGKYSDDKVLKPFDLIIYNTDMSKDKFIAGRTIVVPDIFEDGKNIISSHHLTTMHFDDDRLKWMFYATSATNWFREYIKGFVAGTNVLGLDYVGVADFNMVIPEDNCLTDFADKLYKIEQQKSNLLKENQQLTELRDFLLPMLMNGQIKIGA